MVSGQNLGPDFYPQLVKMTTDLGMKPEDLISVMISESGMNAAAHNPNGNASGLIQFMPATLKGMGYTGTPEEFRKLNGEQQIPWIQKYIKSHMDFQGGKSFASGAQYYVAEFWPAALRLPGVIQNDPKTIIVDSNPPAVNGYSKKYLDIGLKVSANGERAAYKANPLFDKDKKGYITLGDMATQVSQNKDNSIYRQSLLAMQDKTGYQPGKEPQPDKDSRPSAPPSELADLEKIIQEFIGISASDMSLKKLYKQALSHNDILIKITAPDYNSAIEFSRILCSALDEDLLSTSYPHTDGQEVEVECFIAGPLSECFAAVEQMSEAVAETFKDATVKIGGVSVKTECFMNKKSSYQPISLTTAGANYRKFLLKFV
jgi:hypothetical protein